MLFIHMLIVVGLRTSGLRSILLLDFWKIKMCSLHLLSVIVIRFQQLIEIRNFILLFLICLLIVFVLLGISVFGDDDILLLLLLSRRWILLNSSYVII